MCSALSLEIGAVERGCGYVEGSSGKYPGLLKTLVVVLGIL